ncbi:MAG: alpha-glucan family phosphorylase [Dehalococcoidia bacterium]|nr:alpha-glucan family phosphorylase [Dehalococcoidia bacterium]
MAARAIISQGLDLNLPERIGRLDELANNLWWSWNPQARELFRSLDYPLWKDGHNPVRQLRYISREKLESAAGDPSFLSLYDSVLAAFDADTKTENTWFNLNCPGVMKGPVAFFSMEFAIHRSLPIYAGGLGILSGDLCKESSDLGVPLVGVGFMYPQGYFRQCVTDEGWQEERYVQIDFNEAPINPVATEEGGASLAVVYLDDRPVHIRAWEIQVGRTMIYLLDTNLGENAVQDRNLSARLYIADRALRIQQEIVLGVGGVRVLRALGIEPAVWHANEGHTAFMMMERVREEVRRGIPYGEAVKKVQHSTVFTTHTPVPAGHDIFPADLVERNLHSYWESIGVSRDTFLRLGQDTVGTDVFNMTTFALRMSQRRNAVSELHGVVGRRMWHVLWPEVGENEVPITHVTNGVHVPT